MVIVAGKVVEMFFRFDLQHPRCTPNIRAEIISALA